jgi:hypothetical protein
LLKVIAAFLAPFILSIFLILYQLIRIIVTLDGSASLHLSGFLFVYIYALPAYLLLGVPASILIERLNKGIRWVNYALAGALGGIVVVFLNAINHSIAFVYSLESIFFYMLAGFAFYVTLKLLEILEQKKQSV